MGRILVVDDEAVQRAMVASVGCKLGHEVLEAGSIAEGLELAAEGADVVLLDLLLPDGNGLERIREFVALPGQPEILVITGHGDGDWAEMALRSGAWEYLSKPLRVPDLRQSLTQIMAYRSGRHAQGSLSPMDRSLIKGASPALLAALARLHEASSSDVNVLLLGETGVGKELFAKTLYRNSARAGRAFVTVDCASLPETLVESHLFGHCRGAFTGADRARDGLLLAAHKGTLFLDEVGDLPMSMQGAFLRALELRRFRPIGEVEEVPSDFRLVAATNKDPSALVAQGRFRNDLLYRLQGITIHVPPLRQRKEDIVELAQHAVLRFCLKGEIPVKEISSSCLEMLQEYPWPGNVRELMHAMERACVAAKEEASLYASHLPTDIRVAVARGKVNGGRALPPENHACPFGDEVPSLKVWKNRAEKDYVRRLMQHCSGDIRKAAEMAGLSRGHLYELLKKHGI